MNALSVSETLLCYRAFSPLQAGEALSVAAEAQRLRGVYEQFAAKKNREPDAIELSRENVPIVITFHDL